MNEYQILKGLKNHLNELNKPIDDFTYEIIDNYLDNPFNNPKEILDILGHTKDEEKTQFDVYSAHDKKNLSKTLRHIKPCKLARPIASIRTINSKGQNQMTHIPIYTNIKTLKLVA